MLHDLQRELDTAQQQRDEARAERDQGDATLAFLEQELNRERAALAEADASIAHFRVRALAIDSSTPFKPFR